MPNDPTIDIIDNSDLDLTGVPLRDPVADKQWVTVTIKDLYWEQVDTKSGGKGKKLTFEVVTEEPVISTDRREIPIGTKIKDNIWATPSGKLTQDMINKKLGRLQVAVLKLTEPDRFGSPDRYIGQRAKVFLEAESGDRDPGLLFQRITRWDKAS